MKYVMSIRVEVEVEAVVEADSTEAAKKRLEAKLASNFDEDDWMRFEVVNRDAMYMIHGWRPETLTWYCTK